MNLLTGKRQKRYKQSCHPELVEGSLTEPAEMPRHARHDTLEESMTVSPNQLRRTVKSYEKDIVI
jgi:hypothetical protein